MRTLTQPIARWLKEGMKPRTFVRITDATSGAEILPVSSQAQGTYEDRLEGSGSRITRAIRHEGGLAEVGGLSVDVNINDTTLPLCTEATIEAKHEGPIRGAGRLLGAGLPGAGYAAARDSVTGDHETAALVVGRWYNPGSDYYVVARSPMQFTIPAMTSVEEAYIQVDGLGDYNESGAAFAVSLVEGTWSALSEGAGMFDAFDGWESSGDYTLAGLNEAWDSSEFSATGTNYIRLNAAGRAKVLAAAGGVLKLMLVSERDADWTTYSLGPSGNEYLIMNAPTVRLVLRYNSYRLENQIASVYFGVDPLPATHTGMDLMWTGVVDSYSLTPSVLKLELKQNTHKKNPMIPAGIITKATFPNCPEEHVGDGYPVVYGAASAVLMGAHEAGIGYEKHYVSHTDTNEKIGLFDYFSCPVVDPGDATAKNPMRVLVSSRDIHQAYLGVAAVWNSSARLFARMLAYTGLPAGTTYRYLDLIPDRRIKGSYNGVSYSDAEVYEEYFGHVLSLIPTYVEESAGVTDPEKVYGDGVSMDALNDSVTVGFSQDSLTVSAEKIEVCFSVVTTGNCELCCNLIDKDKDFRIYGGDGVIANSGTPGISTFTSASVNFTTAGVTTDDHIVIMGSGAGIYSAISSIDSDHVLLIPAQTAGSSLEFKIIKAGAVVHSFTNIMKNKIGTADVVLDATQYITKSIDNYFIRVYKFAHSAGTAQVSYLQAKYYTMIDRTLREVYLDKQGEEYGSWITGRAGGHASGDLIENPAHVIEAVARQDMGLATAEINTASFDTAATALTGMKFAFQLLERTEARDILDDMAYEGRMKCWWDEQDRLKVKVFNAAAAFPVSATDNPSALDRFTDTGLASGGSYTTHQIVGEPTIRRRLEEMKNKFVIRYRKNYATGEYGAVLTCDRTSTTAADGDLSGTTGAALVALCLACYTELGAEKTLEVEAGHIRDDATATRTLQHLVERLTTGAYEVTLSAGPSANVFEEGDFINIRTAVVENRLGVARMNKEKWEIIRHEPDIRTHDVDITAVQVV